MASVQPRPLPIDALLARYAGPADGAYTDCFVTEAAGEVSLPSFVEAFCTGRVFRLERLLIRALFGKSGTDRLARRLALGEIQAFSAWRVEARTPDQLLMREIISHKTRLWLKVEPLTDGTAPRTRLYFGTAVLPVEAGANGAPRMSVLFNLLWFHRLYARVLLSGARARLARMV
ncbi:hypothetical protein BH11PSE2_BH11PSE2_18670 [soil metagenome]